MNVYRLYNRFIKKELNFAKRKILKYYLILPNPNG